MAKYEYIGKREIMRRMSDLGYRLPSRKECSYSKYEGVEWLQTKELKITVQRGGNWLQITTQQYNFDYEKANRTCNTFTGYDGTKYINHY